MISPEKTQECRDLIAFYDERGWRWDYALEFTLWRAHGGTTEDLLAYRMRRYR